jgi:hypothetical protein
VLDASGGNVKPDEVYAAVLRSEWRIALEFYGGVDAEKARRILESKPSVRTDLRDRTHKGRQSRLLAASGFR